MGGFRLGNNLDVRHRILFPVDHAAFSSAGCQVMAEFHFTESVPILNGLAYKTNTCMSSDSELVSCRGQRDFSM